jgi:hypothetical protein
MSDKEMHSTEKVDTRTVTIRAEIWHACRILLGGKWSTTAEAQQRDSVFSVRQQSQI